MYQIGQFAKLMDISPRMLRHYDRNFFIDFHMVSRFMIRISIE